MSPVRVTGAYLWIWAFTEESSLRDGEQEIALSMAQQSSTQPAIRWIMVVLLAMMACP
jgi:hypothetical protein